MAERDETFYWMFGKDMGQETAHEVTRLNEDFVQVCQHENVSVFHHACNSDQAGSVDRLWLFRLQNPNHDKKLEAGFKLALKGHISTGCQELGLQGDSLKRETFKITPLLGPRLKLNEEWPFVDIGLHPAAPPCNANLRACVYHEGQHRMMLAFLELYQFRGVLRSVDSVWKGVACDCRDADCTVCNGDGCTTCFQASCPRCSGTGWKSFYEWAREGYRVDYTSGFPIAAAAGGPTVENLRGVISSLSGAVLSNESREQRRRSLCADALGQEEDWEGNNAAFHCPVCGKLFIVSGLLHKDGRPCPKCGQSVARIRGGRDSRGQATIEWCPAQEPKGRPCAAP